MSEITLELLPHQRRFVADVHHRYLGFVAGYGSGKTYAFCAKGIYLAFLNKGHTGALFEPTNTMAHDVLVPALTEMLEDYGISYTYKASPYPTFFLHFLEADESITTSTILIRSAENYRRAAGLNLAWAGIDEADTISKSTAWAMWRMLQSRLRNADAPNIQMFTTSTPEGFNFLYEYFVKEVEEREAEGKNVIDRHIMHASTYDNADNLDPGYIQTLLEEYPPNLIEGYLNGQFTNLTQGTVYNQFNRRDNNTDLTITDFDDKERNLLVPLHIGIDFNIDKTCGIVHVIDSDGLPLALDEITKQRDTETLIKEIQKRYPDREITVYPDSSGDNRKTNASATDIKLLKAAGFRVKANNKNPPVRDRVNSMNAMFCNAEGERRYKVNVRMCPTYTRALETQAYDDKGEPDKAHDQDHPLDGAGYFIFKVFPLRHRTRKVKIVGI
jgi:phage terminase large subunit-like protein